MMDTQDALICNIMRDMKLHRAGDREMEGERDREREIESESKSESERDVFIICPWLPFFLSTLLLNQLRIAGSLLVFDELLNFPYFEREELRAFYEFLRQHRWKYRIVHAPWFFLPSTSDFAELYQKDQFFLHCWLVVWNHGILFFPSSWECHHPKWRTPSFFRGGCDAPDPSGMACWVHGIWVVKVPPKKLRDSSGGQCWLQPCSWRFGG